jgi:HlyD family secretion protein
MVQRVLAVVVLLLLIAGCGGTLALLAWRDAAPSEEISFELPERRAIVRKTVATGSIVPRTEVLLKPAVSGIVEEVVVEPGDLVERGALLALLRVVPSEAALTSAEATVSTARLGLEQAERELDRVRRLAGAGAITAVELSDAEAAWQLARAEAQAAQASLQVVRDGARRRGGEVSTEVRATIAGMVLTVDVKEGQSVIERNPFNEGTTVATVADMGDLLFLGKVDESEVGKLNEGLELKITVGAYPDQPLAGTLEHVAPKGLLVDGAVQFEVRAAVKAPDGLFLRAGVSANAEIVLEEREGALALREALLQFQDGKPYVEVGPPDALVRRDLQLGLSDGLWVEVRDGLTEGEPVRRPAGVPAAGRRR